MPLLKNGKPACVERSRPRVLLVEDDPEIGHAFTRLLADRYAVRLETTGAAALRRFRESGPFDLVLLDYRLPDRSGIDVLRELKLADPSVPVLFLTAFGSEDVAIQAFTTGAKDYLRKPFTCAALVEKIEFCLSLKERNGDRNPRAALLPTRHSAGRTDREGRACYYKVQKAVKYIDEHFTRPLSLAEAADRACISPFHFSRVFREIVGVPFKQYLVGLRIERAKELLGNSALTVADAAAAVGYDEPAHFIKLFKKRTGRTPTEYRSAPGRTAPPP